MASWVEATEMKMHRSQVQMYSDSPKIRTHDL